MPARIIETKAGPYRMLYRPAPISRLMKPSKWRMRMIGDPIVETFDWDEETRAIYEHMIAEKRKGLWYYL